MVCEDGDIWWDDDDVDDDMKTHGAMIPVAAAHATLSATAIPPLGCRMSLDEKCVGAPVSARRFRRRA